MTDLSLTIAPKSDQLNADDLIGGAKTIRITKVSACPGSVEQPIAISFEGDNDKPFKPCKSMRRVFVQIWGKDGNQYTGRHVTLFRDPRVQFGGLAVGGIRISHMSEIDKDITVILTETKKSRKPFTVKPLVAEAATIFDQARDAASRGTQFYRSFWTALTKAQQQPLLSAHENFKRTAAEVDAKKAPEPQTDADPTDDPFAESEAA